MALQIDFNVQQTSDCSEFVLTDTTGDYGLLNPTGFGAPNPDRTDIVTCIADVTFPDGTVVTGVVCTLPSLGTETIFDSTNLGTSGDVSEGVWSINYQMTDVNGGQYSTTKSFLLYCNTQCCLDKAIANLELNTKCTDCNNSAIDNYSTINAFLTAAIYAADCNKPKKAQALLDQASFLCARSKCSCN